MNASSLLTAQRCRRGARTPGFTLIELLIALVVVGVLAAIAYPSYQYWIIAGRRADATTALMDLANRLQRYYTERNTYETATIANVGASEISPQGYYTLSISDKTATTYTILATRRAPQTADTRCGDLTLTSTNVKGMINNTATRSDQCW